MATVRGWHLGGLLISAVDFDSQRFVRDRRKTVVDGLDHYLVRIASSDFTGRPVAGLSVFLASIRRG